MGKSIIYLPSCHSTNEVAGELLNSKDLEEGTIIITDNQTKGRGQRGNSWEAAPQQNLTFTVVLQPEFLPVNQQFFLNMTVALAVRDALSAYIDSCVVKWPNDVLSNKTKLAGILIQNFVNGQHINQSLIGLGINVNQQSFSAPRAGSIHTLTGKTFILPEVLENIALSLEHYYRLLKEGEFETIRMEYYKYLFLLGQAATFKAEHEFTGEITGVTQEGMLKINSDGNELTFATKEVEYVY